MNEASSGRRGAPDLPRRLEAYIAVALALLVAIEMSAALLIARRVVTNGSFDRASRDLATAQSAFYRIEDDRGEFAAAQASLVTALPLFRAYLPDSRPANDPGSLEMLAEECRRQLKAAFCIVTGRGGKRRASSGSSGAQEPPPAIVRMIAASASGRPGRNVTELGGQLFVVVSEPARFAEEVLGTLTVGYPLDDAVAQQLAHVTHCEVNIVVGRRLAASSLTGDRRSAFSTFLAADRPLSFGIAERTERVGGGEYVAGVFPLWPGGSSDAESRLVLLQDWAPDQRHLNQLQRQLFAAGGAIFLVALAGGLIFARRASLSHWSDEATKRDDELQQPQKMEALGRLAAGIAHDFNNLLTAITGYSELVLHRLAPQDPARSEVEEILAATNRAAELIRQLLAFGRPQDASPRILALDEVITTTERMLRRVIGENIELVVSSGRDIGRVRADRSQIEQVLLNLAVNARDAMPNGGTLRIGLENVVKDLPPHDVLHVSAPKHYVCLSVADTGHGMDRETAARIFEPFFTTKEAGRGTGLGLAIVYGIVEGAGGMIEVETEMGRGTTFLVYLPQTADDEPSDRVASAVEPGAPALEAGGKTVLLVEDDQRLNMLIGHTLRTIGYRVLEAEHGEQALEVALAHRGPIDLLLTDVVMPGMNGHVLSERVRSNRPETHVLFMSGYSDDAVLKYGVQAASMPFIQKPFSMAALIAKVRDTLQSSGTAHATS